MDLNRSGWELNYSQSRALTQRKTRNSIKKNRRLESKVESYLGGVGVLSTTRGALFIHTEIDIIFFGLSSDAE